MRVVLAALFLSIILFGAFFFLSSYRSAFEADQACHFQQWESYAENSNFGCDHDFETKQWILFEVGANHQQSKVLKRFRY